MREAEDLGFKRNDSVAPNAILAKLGMLRLKKFSIRMKRLIEKIFRGVDSQKLF